MPWAKRLEEEADWKLIGSRSQASYTRIALQALMRGDSSARADFYERMFRMGVFSPNKILELEDMDPIGPEGDEHYIQKQFTTLKRIVDGAEDEEPAGNPRELVDGAVNRLLSAQVRKVESVRRRYDRVEFAAWLDKQSRDSEGRRLSAMMDIEPQLSELLGRAVSPHKMANAYLDAERKTLFSCYDGQPPVVENVTNAVLEAT